MNYEYEYTRLLNFLLYRNPGILYEYVRSKDRPIQDPTPKPLVRCVRLMRAFLNVF